LLGRVCCEGVTLWHLCSDSRVASHCGSMVYSKDYRRWRLVSYLSAVCTSVGVVLTIAAMFETWLIIKPIEIDEPCKNTVDNDLSVVVGENWKESAFRQGTNLTRNLFLLGGLVMNKEMTIGMNGLYSESALWRECPFNSTDCTSDKTEIRTYTYNVWSGKCWDGDCSVPEQASFVRVGNVKTTQEPGCAGWKAPQQLSDIPSLSSKRLQPKEEFLQGVLCQAAQATIVSTLFSVIGYVVSVAILLYVIKQVGSGHPDHIYDRETLILAYFGMSSIASCLVIFSTVFFGFVSATKVEAYGPWIAYHYSECQGKHVILDYSLGFGFYFGLAGGALAIVSTVAMNISEKRGGGNVTR